MIDIENLTVKELRELTALACSITGTKKTGPAKSPLIGKKVIVRTQNAGVFFGTLVAKQGEEVTLDGARRIWSWQGANTLSEMALSGLNASSSKVGEPVNGHVARQWIELIPCSDAAAKIIEGAKWAK